MAGLIPILYSISSAYPAAFFADADAAVADPAAASAYPDADAADPAASPAKVCADFALSSAFLQLSTRRKIDRMTALRIRPLR